MAILKIKPFDSIFSQLSKNTNSFLISRADDAFFDQKPKLGVFASFLYGDPQILLQKWIPEKILVRYDVSCLGPRWLLPYF